MKVRYTRRARLQLLAVRDYLSNRSPSASTRVMARIRTTIQLLADFPELGADTGRLGMRQLVVPRYLYVVVYRIERDPAQVSILGVFHSARGERSV